MAAGVVFGIYLKDHSGMLSLGQIVCDRAGCIAASKHLMHTHVCGSYAFIILNGSSLSSLADKEAFCAWLSKAIARVPFQ